MPGGRGTHAGGAPTVRDRSGLLGGAWTPGIVAPAALVGCVALVGLLVFSPGAARAVGAPTTTQPSQVAPAHPAVPTSVPRGPSASATVHFASPSNQSGITYVDPPRVVHRPRPGTLRSQLLELPRQGGQRGHRRWPPTCRGSEPGPSTSGSPPAGCPWPTRARRPSASPRGSAGSRPSRSPPGCSRSPPARGPRSRWSRPPAPTSRRAAPCSPSTARPATPSPGPGTRWPRGPTHRASTWPRRPRWSRPSAPARATCPTSGPATSPTPRRVTSPPT